MSAAAALAIEVVSGVNVGTRLMVDGQVRTIGRARDADLVLSDLGVSRRHLQVVASPSGILLQACDGAAALMIDGRPYRSFTAGLGTQFVVGSTRFVVNSASLDDEVSAAKTNLDTKTVLTGVGADALAMAAVYELIEELDRARGHEELAPALNAWAERQRPNTRAEVRAERREGPSELVAAGVTHLSVPAPSDEPASLEFDVETGDALLPEPHRRMLVVAGRLYGSSLTRLRRSEIDATEVASLRALSFGAARSFLGSSPAAKDLAAKVPRLAASDVNVLLEGETGVGKTFVARLIHEASARAREPLRVINCAAIPESLLESELFGHERGAFSGAASQRIGALESAGRGTLFLDEIGELPMSSQAKLLHVLEERAFERLGSNGTVPLEARVIFATNRDLDQMIGAGGFRRDLLFRIAVIRVRVPSLYERREDIPELAKQLLADAAQLAGRRVTGFSPEALSALTRYSWPGNVRELRNAIEHAVAMGDTPLILPGDLPSLLSGLPAQPADLDAVRLPLPLADLERRGILSALRHTGGNKTRAAALLGISRPYLYTRLSESSEGEGDP
jgi:DNA-binding NtrC family response regulator/pSer/pThr/pTyr-binding forkhead associated (FHA) protein